MVCGRELAAKAVLLNTRSLLHEDMIAPSAFSKMLMLHFSLHAEKLANINKEKDNKEKGQN